MVVAVYAFEIDARVLDSDLEVHRKEVREVARNA
jgi:hypothetical protein